MRGIFPWLAAGIGLVLLLVWPRGTVILMDQNQGPLKAFLRVQPVGPEPGQAGSPCDDWLRQALDPSHPLPMRLAAIKKLAEECRTHPVFQALGLLVNREIEDLAVRRAVLRAFPDWNESFSINAVVQALSIPGLRAVAVETLQQVGAVKGSREARLLSELAALRTGSVRGLLATSLPSVFGRDPRLLSYLNEKLRSGDRWDRAFSASALLGLGDVDAALTAARAPEPRVRKSLAWAIGWYHEQRGMAVLRGMLGDSDPGVVQRAAYALSQLGISPGTVPEADFRWRPLLKELSEFRLRDPEVAKQAGVERSRAGWLGETGAAETKIQGLEQRLGRRLPPSYRAFLLESNGFQQQSAFIHQLYGTGEVDWFHVHHADWADAYRETYPDLGACLQVSAEGDSAVVLLNPKVISSDGEWQAYFFANWIPGARPFRSFRELMENELDSLCEWRNRSGSS